MPEPSPIPRHPADWQQSLARSKAQIAFGDTLPLLPVLDRLRASAERVEAAMNVSADDVEPRPHQ